MAKNGKAQQAMLAQLYFGEIRGWQGLLDYLRAKPQSEDRDTRINRTLQSIRTYEQLVMPIPRPGMTLEEERREEEFWARKCREAHIASGGKDPWADVPVYDGSPII